MRKRARKEKMGRAPCCVKGEVKKGTWTPEEDRILVDYITKNGHGTWRSLPKLAGLQRCGKSCRLRWTNYLRPDIKRGAFSVEEEQTIFQLHSLMGNKWATIASRLPGRTDNEIKNFWNSHLRKRIPNKGLNLQDYSPSISVEDTKPDLPSTCQIEESESTRMESEARLSVDPYFPTTPLTGLSGCDYFLRVWNSGVGDAFQKVKDSDTVACSSPGSSQLQASCFVKVEPESNVIMMPEPTISLTPTGASADQSYKVDVVCKKEAEEMANTSDSPDSFETEKSSDITMDLLLDFPNDGEYLEYLQGESNDNCAAFPPN